MLYNSVSPNLFLSATGDVEIAKRCDPPPGVPYTEEGIEVYNNLKLLRSIIGSLGASVPVFMFLVDQRVAVDADMDA